MSDNVVKWNYIRFGQDDRHVIDSDTRTDLLAEVLAAQRRAEEEKRRQAAMEAAGQDGDLLGEDPDLALPGIDEEEISQARERLLKEAEDTLADARAEAEGILQAAREEADGIKASAYNVGKSDGYLAGMEEGNRKILAMEADLKEQARVWEEEYDQKLAEAEPKFVDLVIGLIEKVTGVMVENKREVILHLVHNGIRQIGRSERYVIQCSPEDFPLLEGEKERLCAAAGISEGVEIVENAEFGKNQCVIEADSSILDCSLDIQLRNLEENLRLLNLS